MVEVKKQKLKVQKIPSQSEISPLCVYMFCSALFLPPPVLSFPLTWLPPPLSLIFVSHTCPCAPLPLPHIFLPPMSSAASGGSSGHLRFSVQ